MHFTSELITQTLFVIISLAGLLYFVITPRKFDGLAMAFGASVIYFLPGFFSYTLQKNNQLQISSECYLVMIMVVGSLLLTAFFTDIYSGNNHTELRSRYYNIPMWALFLPLSLTIIDFSGMFYAIYVSGSSLLSVDKQEMLATYGRGHLIWLMGAPTALIACVVFKRWALASINLISLAVILYTGTRAQVAVGVLGSLYVLLARRGSVPLIRNKKIVITMILFCAFIFLYKQCYIAIKMGDYESVSTRLTERWAVAFTESEPFTIQHTLNSVILEGYTVPAFEHLSHSVLANFDFNDRYTAREASFGDVATYALFGDVGYGLASNIWAEFYACGGFLGVGLFVAIYVYSLSLLRSLRDPSVKMCIMSAWIPWMTFYIHRNDTYRMISFSKQYALVIVLGIILGYALSLMYSLGGHGVSRQIPNSLRARTN